MAKLIRDMQSLQPHESWAAMRNWTNEVVQRQGEWAGAPMLSGEARLVLEKRYPYQKLNGMKFNHRGRIENPEPDIGADGAKLINHWICSHRGVGVMIIEEKNGERWKVFSPNGPGLRQDYNFRTMGIASEEIWSVEAETEALAKLKELVTRQAYKTYFLSGCFLETSKRSKVTYMFRKLRPTLAYKPDLKERLVLLAALCLHPLGFYAGTFAGVMTPTDDVIAHLLMMRGCEKKFWAKANHHSPEEASSGI